MIGEKEAEGAGADDPTFGKDLSSKSEVLMKAHLPPPLTTSIATLSAPFIILTLPECPDDSDANQFRHPSFTCTPSLSPQNPSPFSPVLNPSPQNHSPHSSMSNCSPQNPSPFSPALNSSSPWEYMSSDGTHSHTDSLSALEELGGEVVSFLGKQNPSIELTFLVV